MKAEDVMMELEYHAEEWSVLRDAIALIRELTEENESLKEMNKALADGFETVKNGTLVHFIEKARLQAFCVGDEQYISLNELDEIMREV